MAFNTSVAASAAQNDSWKAQAFLNLYLPKKDGGKTKIGKGIPLKESSAFEAALIKRLQEEGGMEGFVGSVIIEFRLADVSHDVDLGF